MRSRGQPGVATDELGNIDVKRMALGACLAWRAAADGVLRGQHRDRGPEEWPVPGRQAARHGGRWLNGGSTLSTPRGTPRGPPDAS